MRSTVTASDDDGWVAATHGIEPIERVAAPRAGESSPVPGVGACFPEVLPGGWLLRPVPGGAVPLQLWLDLDTAPGYAVVEGTTTWRYPLTPRHVEILGLLMRAGPAGMDAFELSKLLFGNKNHVVAVRAELTRLRRKLGGLVFTRPYRIASNVTYELPNFRSDHAQLSTLSS